MDVAAIKDAFAEFYRSYDESAIDAICEEHAQKFSDFWKGRIMKGDDSIADSEIDDIVLMLDTHAKGSTPEVMAVARTMIRQNQWRKMFRDLVEQEELRESLNAALYADDVKSEIDAIHALFQHNRGNGNSLTGKYATAVSAFRALARPFDNLSAVSLYHRDKMLSFLGIEPPGYADMPVWEKVVESNRAITDYFQRNRISSNARTISNFFYRSSINDVWLKEAAAETGVTDDKVEEEVSTQPYSIGEAVEDLFYPLEEFEMWLGTLRRKKNIILQGPPGVGKTFVARRLAYALIGRKDAERVKMVQFHQSYSYEDFIRGFRPDPAGSGFSLQDGVFYTFCRRAAEEEHEEPKRDYVFIIDEINRGNLSKIFGELMMLIESDKRGKGHAMELAYRRPDDEPFYVPANVHLIGMMNTADRSLAMVDYALRRRFAFIDMRPRFHDKRFQELLRERGTGEELARHITGKLRDLNKIIAKDDTNLGLGFCIGHSYFCPSDGERIDRKWFEQVVEQEIAPLLREYWFDDQDKADAYVKDLLA